MQELDWLFVDISSKSAYQDFIRRFSLLIQKNPALITTTLSNIFTMRLVGNKTHGDLAEIAIAEFINQYLYDFTSVHVGKDLFRAKGKEEDVKIINDLTQENFNISLKAYGDGPLQLSTDKTSAMYSLLQSYGSLIDHAPTITAIFSDVAFVNFSDIHVLPLIYNEKARQCNILTFDYDRAKDSIRKIVRASHATRVVHPNYHCLDAEGSYVFEVRYGDTKANALQRGFWTDTKRATRYFQSLTGGWISYSHNPILVKMLSQALLATPDSHQQGLVLFQADIDQQKSGLGAK